jgi:hypothetical protein
MSESVVTHDPKDLTAFPLPPRADKSKSLRCAFAKYFVNIEELVAISPCRMALMLSATFKSVQLGIRWDAFNQRMLRTRKFSPSGLDIFA